MTDVKAHISGVVFRIDARVGAKVAAGATVVTLESMKMEMPVEAEREGTVAEILVSEGQYVDEGEVVARLA